MPKIASLAKVSYGSRAAVRLDSWANFKSGLNAAPRLCPLPPKALQILMRPRKEPWSRPLADLVGPIIDPVLAKRGFGQSDVILYWDEIVGERLAAMSQPLRLNWPPRPPAPQLSFVAKREQSQNGKGFPDLSLTR